MFKDIVANKASFLKLQEERYVRYENLPLETKDGHTIWVEFVSNAYDVNGRQVMQCNIRDISERKQAEDALRMRASELSVLYKTSQSLQKLLTPESLSQEIVELLEKTLSYEYGAVLLIEEPGRRLIPFAIVGHERGEEFIKQDKELILSHAVSVGKGVTGWVAEHGESVLIGDVQKDTRYYGLRENIQSEMCVPLRSGDRIIGVVNIESTRLNAYNENDLRVLETIAAQISVSIQNARLLESELKRRQEAEALQQATAAITSSLDLKNILESLLEQLSAVVPLDSAAVILHENEQLVLVAAQGFAHPERVMGQEFPAGDPLSKIMFETRRFIIIPNVREDARFKHWGETSLIKGWMGIPLIVQEQVIGYLTVDSQTVDAYNESHAELAQSFANQAAVAIHNARLLDETRLSRDRLADLTRKLVEAQETEARAIGREL
ncbi:MAG: GAF domain-containing protein, partial [Anaerolineales bacterium]|nr:GAF domain-containing protein [Anaerolineales bacterium]